MAGSTQIAIVGFRELDVLDGWSIEVVVGGVVSGRIHRGDDDTYRYFDGPSNEISWSAAWSIDSMGMVVRTHPFVPGAFSARSTARATAALKPPADS